MADSQVLPAHSKAVIFLRRTASTLLLWCLVTSVFISHYTWAFLALMGGLGILATIEFYRMLRASGVVCFPRFGMLLGVCYSLVIYWQLHQGNREVSFAIDAAAIFISIAGAFTLQLGYPIRGHESLVAVAANVLGFLYVPFLFNFLARLSFMVPEVNSIQGRVGDSGAFTLLWLLAVTKFADMGAYIIGSMMGRHKMIPHVSPGKTWEGFGGALLFSQLAGCGLYALFPVQLAFFHAWGHVVFLSLLLAVLAVIGDLAESVVKRALDAKDSGKMLPGIGGSLDLIDSICFTAPALYFYIRWILLPHP